ncbi:MAG: DUF6387 family protein [Methylococcales bacterium]|nr:DUF6387 family protein [Methylococcales bacterium]
MIKNKLDLSWFDLKNYDPLKRMQIGGWISVIESRVFANNGHYDFYRTELVSYIKSGSPITDDSKYQAHLHEQLAESNKFKKSYSTASVNSLSTFDLWRLTRELHHPNPNDEHMSEISALCQIKHKPGGTHENMHLTLKPYEINLREAYYPDQQVREAHLTVNLMATDEQIKSDFKKWLNEYRVRSKTDVIETKHQGAKKVKHVFDSVDFKKWCQYQVIPYIDLKTVSKLEERPIKKAELARLLFPDIDTASGVKKLNTSIKIADSILKNNAHETLRAQLLKEKIP